MGPTKILDKMVSSGAIKYGGDTYNRLKQIIANTPFTKWLSNGEWVSKSWNEAEQIGIVPEGGGNKNKQLRGQILEQVFLAAIINDGLLPVHLRFRIRCVYTTRFDFVWWRDQKHPWTLNVKTSLRERFKQAICDSILMKRLYPDQMSYVFTLNREEAIARQRDIAGENVEHHGVYGFFHPSSTNFYDWWRKASKSTFVEKIPKDAEGGGVVVR